MSYLEYCSNCGKKNIYGFIDGGLRYHCLNCNSIHYENPKPTSTLICPESKNILLVKRAVEPGKGLWGLPGGFIELNETPDQAAIRELKEETNLDGRVNCQLGYTSHFNSLHGDILLLAFLMDVSDFKDMVAGDDADDAKLFPLNQLPQLAFTSHEKIVEMYINYLNKLKLSV
ncbi:MAG: NUDIX hydrolase [Candidatus Marinimicrobia bacterium]|nr:NUDIX hydrolase [Candidatus Neomarinimicrobiota bacterium]|tara:strand:- start:4891 stop:5409 length:519 start_codon:yes stop_codon:yes gene_type:complete